MEMIWVKILKECGHTQIYRPLRCNALEMIANYFSPLSPVCFPAFCCLEDSFMYKSYHLHLLSGLQGKISHWVLCDENRRKETLKLRDKEFDFPLL